MKSKISPRYAKVELLQKTSVGKSPDSVALAEALHDVCLKATSVFAIKYSTDNANTFGSEKFTTDGRPGRGTNLPTGDMAYAQLGLYLACVFQTPFQGRLVGEMLFEKPSADDKSSNADGMPELYDFVCNEKDYLQVKTDLKAIIQRACGHTDNHWGLTENLKTFLMNTKVLDDIKALVTLFQKITANPLSERPVTYLWSCLINIVREYELRFLDHNFNAIGRALVTRDFDLYDCLIDEDKLLECFKTWHYTNLRMEEYKTFLDKLQFEFKDIDIANGTIILPVSYYEALVTHAVTDSAACETSIFNFDSEFKTWNENAKVLSFQRVVAKKLGWSGVQDTSHWYDLFLLEKYSNVTVTEEDFMRTLNYVNAACSRVHRAFIDFCEEMFCGDIEYILPRCKFRTTIHNGIRAAYTFLFDVPYTMVYLGYKVRFSSAGLGLATSEGSQLTCFDPVKIIEQPYNPDPGYHDVVRNPLYLKACGKFYGRNFVPQSVLKVMLDYFADEILTNAGTPTSWNYEQKNIAYQILPPLNVAREFDILKQDAPRGTYGTEYRVDTIKLEPGIDLVDLFFTFSRAEIEAPANLETLYRARLNRLLRSDHPVKSYKYLEWKWDSVMIPNYALLLGFAQSNLPKLYERAHAIRVIPQNLLEIDKKNNTIKVDKVNKARSTLFILDRYVEFTIPIPRSNVKSEYEQNMADPASKLIFKTSETRNGKPSFSLYKEEFATHYFKNCYKAVLNIDLGEDVTWRTAVITNLNKDKIHIRIEPEVPGFEAVDPINNERYLIRDGSSGVIDGRDLLSMAFNTDEVTAWFELAISLAREVVLTEQYEKVSARALLLQSYASENFALPDGNDVLIKSFDGAETFSYLKLTEVLKRIAEAKTDGKPVNKAAEPYTTCLQLLQEVYGNVQSLKFPINYNGDYKSLLEDIRKGAVREPARLSEVRDLSMRAQIPCLVKADFVQQFSLFILANKLDKLLHRRRD